MAPHILTVFWGTYHCDHSMYNNPSFLQNLYHNPPGYCILSTKILCILSLTYYPMTCVLLSEQFKKGVIEYMYVFTITSHSLSKTVNICILVLRIHQQQLLVFPSQSQHQQKCYCINFLITHVLRCQKYNYLLHYVDFRAHSQLPMIYMKALDPHILCTGA